MGRKRTSTPSDKRVIYELATSSVITQFKETGGGTLVMGEWRKRARLRPGAVILGPHPRNLNWVEVAESDVEYVDG